jgi:hypothetical protein
MATTCMIFRWFKLVGDGTSTFGLRRNPYGAISKAGKHMHVSTLISESRIVAVYVYCRLVREEMIVDFTSN